MRLESLRAQWSQVLREAAGGLPRAYWYVWVGSVVNRLGTFVVPFLALYLTQERGLSVEQAGLVVSLHGAGAIFAGPVGGVLADRLGRRWTMVAGQWSGACAMLLLGWVREPWHIAAAAMLLGFTGELYRPAVSAAVADLVGPLDRPRAYGVLYWGVNIGFSLALPLAGWLTGYGFWLLFVGDALTTFLYGCVVWWKVPETRPAAAAQSSGLQGRLLSLAPFQDKVFLAFGLPVIVVAMIFFQYHVTLALDLTSRGMTPGTFGKVVAVNGLVVVLLQPFAGRWVRGVRRSRVLALAAGLTGLGFGLHALPAEAGLAALAVAVWTLGEVAHASAAPTVVADLAPESLRGTYQGAYHMLWALAACLAPAVGGWVYGRQGTYVLWGGCLVLGLLAALWHLAIARARQQRLESLRQAGQAVGASVD